MKLDILFRSCSGVYAFHGGRRVVGSTKSEIILRCLRSLIQAIHRSQSLGSQSVSLEVNLDLSLTVIDDHSDANCVSSMKQMLANAAFPTQWISLEATGNGASLICNYEYAWQNCPDYIYFVEDDYLHAPDSFAVMVNNIQGLNGQVQGDLVLFPCDYPDLYRRNYPSAIVLTKHCYWRNIGHTTGTIMLHQRVLLNHWDCFLKLARYGTDPGVCEDNSINLVYQQVPCFSPMPSLAVHLSSPECMSPFVPWQKWWEANA